MLGLIRLAAMFLVALAVVYWSLLLWFRAGERARLEREWERERPPLPRHTHVAIGLGRYLGRLKPRLFLGVVVLPVVLAGLLIYALN